MFGTFTKIHFLIHTSTKTVFFFLQSSLNSIVYLFVGCLPRIYFSVPSNVPVVYVGRLIPVLDSKMDPNPHHPSQWLVQRWTRGPKKANQTRRFSSRTSTPGRSHWGSALLTSLLVKARRNSHGSCRQPPPTFQTQQKQRPRTSELTTPSGRKAGPRHAAGMNFGLFSKFTEENPFYWANLS